jgi:ABC-type transport system substrate-binding protein
VAVGPDRPDVPGGTSCLRPRAPSTKPSTWCRRSASSATGPRCGCSRTAPTSPTPTTPATHAQVIDVGWGAGYASADNFIGKLACAYFVPGHALATTDASEFCDPALDRQIARAAAQQAINPAAAASLWAQLDRKLTDLAILVPTVTPNEIDFLSSRVRNYLYNPIHDPRETAERREREEAGRA